MRYLAIVFSTFMTLTGTEAHAAACSDVRYGLCLGAFPTMLPQAQILLKWSVDAHHPILHDQGACEDVSHTISTLAGEMASSGSASLAATTVLATALVAGNCAECICAKIY
jgi:hypothetical protein